jgi:hypothetical protein
MSDYTFTNSADPTKYYLFYLHGKIIEDQGIPAVDPVHGEYEYQAILEKLSSFGLVVISEQRAKDTDGIEYAKKITGQITTLLEAGIAAKNITVVGASKGAGITFFISNFLGNAEVNYVVMGICAPDEVDYLLQNQIILYGNFLSIYDSVDPYGGSCQELFSFSTGKGIGRYGEILLDVSTGHGILYQPLDEWIMQVVDWTGMP